eukprot:g1923.t1
MARHDGDDPGLLGLKILNDERDLDLGSDVIDCVQVDAARDLEDRKARLGIGDRSASGVRSFDLRVVKDPSGDLPSVVQLVLGSTRLILTEREEHAILTEWAYETIKSWGEMGRQRLYVHVSALSSAKGTVTVDGESVWRFEFDSLENTVLPKTVLNALYDRCRTIMTLRRRHKCAQKHLNSLLPKNHRENRLHTFSIERLYDPSQMLPKKLRLHVTNERLLVVDAATDDVIFNWPFTTVFSWRVDYGEIHLTIVESTGNLQYGFGTGKSWIIKYAIETSINKILRHNGDHLLKIGDDIPDAELKAIQIATKSFERDIRIMSSQRTRKDDPIRAESVSAMPRAQVNPEEVPPSLFNVAAMFLGMIAIRSTPREEVAAGKHLRDLVGYLDELNQLEYLTEKYAGEKISQKERTALAAKRVGLELPSQ